MGSSWHATVFLRVNILSRLKKPQLPQAAKPAISAALRWWCCQSTAIDFSAVPNILNVKIPNLSQRESIARNRDAAGRWSNEKRAGVKFFSAAAPTRSALSRHGTDRLIKNVLSAATRCSSFVIQSAGAPFCDAHRAGSRSRSRRKTPLSKCRQRTFDRIVQEPPRMYD